MKHLRFFLLFYILMSTQWIFGQTETEIEGAVKIGNEIISNPALGTIRWNESSSDFEGFTEKGWVSLTNSDVQYDPFGARQSQITEYHKLPEVSAEEIGVSIDIHRDLVVIGSYKENNERGAVYIFYRNENRWFLSSVLTALDGADGDQFGKSVAIDNPYVIIGAPMDTENGPGSGSAYLYIRDGYTADFNFIRKLLPSDGASGDSFGWAVVINNNKAVVTANLKHSNQGAAYVFQHINHLWSQNQKLLASNGQSGDRFGWDVDLSGNTIVIGAITADSTRGSAYVFTYKANSWIEQQIHSPDGLAGDRFGRSVSLSDAHIAVGAYKHSANGSNAGAVYTYQLADTNWTYQQKIVPNNTSGQVEYFGWSLNQSGDYLVVGSRLEDVIGNDSGAAYIYKWINDDAWQQMHKLVPSDGQANANFGWSVRMDGRYIIIGAPFQDTLGSIYCY